MERDQMRIEYVFGELTKTIQLLEEEETDISNNLVTVLINVYTDNDNLIVSLKFN